MPLMSESFESTDNTPQSSAVKTMLAQEKRRITPQFIFSVVVAISVLVYTGQVSDLSFGELIEGGGNMAEYISRYWPPDFSDWKSYVKDTIETVSMGVWGTLFAAILSAPLGVLA